MIKKLALLASVFGVGMAVSTPASASPDVCYACIPDVSTGELSCVILVCGGGGGTAIVPDNRRH